MGKDVEGSRGSQACSRLEGRRRRKQTQSAGVHEPGRPVEERSSAGRTKGIGRNSGSWNSEVNAKRAESFLRSFCLISIHRQGNARAFRETSLRGEDYD